MFSLVRTLQLLRPPPYAMASSYGTSGGEANEGPGNLFKYFMNERKAKLEQRLTIRLPLLRRPNNSAGVERAGNQRLEFLERRNDWKKFRVVAGEVTEEERAFVIRNGLVTVGDDGEYQELSTIIDSEGDTDEEEENIAPMEQKENKADGPRLSRNLITFNKSVDESLGSLEPSRAFKKDDGRSSMDGRKSYTRILSPLVTNNAGLDQSNDSSISGIPKPNLLSPAFTPENKGNVSNLQIRNVDSSSASAVSPEAELTYSSEDTPKPPTPEKISETSWYAKNDTVPITTPDRAMETMPFAFATPTPGREGIHSMSAPTPDSSLVTPETPFETENAQNMTSSPSIVAKILGVEDQSLANIQCPSTYSSPGDFNSPVVASTRSLGTTLFQTPASFLSPASRRQLNKTVELMDISYGALADEIAVSSLDTSKDDSGLKMDHPVVISEQYIETPTNVQTIDEILDMRGTEENLFACHSSAEHPKGSDLTSKLVEKPAGAEKSRDYDILILEPREPDGTFGAGVEEEFVDDCLSSGADLNGIDAMSPASVGEELSFNNTSNSLADISLDDISNDSFHLSDVEDDDEKVHRNESFRTCPSVVSTTSYTSCNEDIDDDIHIEEGRSSIEPINEEVKSFEDLDDTMTMVEKLLLQAEELEAIESNNVLFAESQTKSPVSYLQPPGMTPTSVKMDCANFEELSPSIFATPKTPIKQKSANGVIFATPAGPAPRAKTTNLEANYFSPSSKPALPPTPPRVTTLAKPPSPSPKKIPTSSPSPSPKSTPRKLNNILDSPVRKTPGIPTKASGLKTPSKMIPVSSPVANYIYSVPPPVQVRKMIPPPKLPSVLSPKSKVVEKDTKIPRMKVSMPFPSASNEESDIVSKKPGRDTLNSLFPQSKSSKEFAPTNYVGPDNVTSVSGSITTPSKLPTPKLGTALAFGSSKHLGIRDSNNASMVAQQPAVRKFCPERVLKP
ncbi:unnamed protein product [Allacma fusca]|uniref:Uncharacterized protein n=1 Tax=Allacma fusca TaxID=39272 RepID=A0A8J2PLG4_9HEXA|nr:unnamed protein product [Allacma fusca]